MTVRKHQNSDLIDRLTGDEAKAVIRRLLDESPDLLASVERHARDVLGEVSFGAIADDVEDAMRAVDVEELYARAGGHDGGYTSPGDAAYELLEEAIEPFLDDLRRRRELGNEAEALAICQGVLLGLYRMRDQMKGDVLDEAPDFPGDMADTVIDVWSGGDRRGRRRGGRAGRRELPRSFVEKYIPDWDSRTRPPAPRRRGR
jgi:hypothetical protein